MTKEQLHRPQDLLNNVGDRTSIEFKILPFIHKPSKTFITEVTNLQKSPTRISNRIVNYFSYIQVISCSIMPDIVGKIIPFNITRQVQKLINNSISEKGKISLNPFESTKFIINFELKMIDGFGRKIFDIDAYTNGKSYFSFGGVSYEKDTQENRDKIQEIMKSNMSMDFLDLEKDIKTDELLEQENKEADPKALWEEVKNYAINAIYSDRTNPIPEHLKDLYIKTLQNKK